MVLKQIGFSSDNSDVYVNLISLSIGYNPRGFKRIFNTYLLLKMIYEDMSFDTPQIQAMLFAVLCLQMSYADIYNYFVLNEAGIVTAELLMSLTDTEQLGDSDDVKTFFEEISQLNIDNDKEEIKEFMGDFCAAIKNEKGMITENDMELLGKVLRIFGTASDSINNHAVGNGKIGKGVWYNNKWKSEFSYHSIKEEIEKNNAPSGWNGCKLDGYRLLGTETKESNFSTVVVNILAELYKRNPEKFVGVQRQSSKYKLDGLFLGSKNKDSMVAPKKILGMDIEIETKNSYDQKVIFLRHMFIAMEESSLPKLNIKLAHRITKS